MFSNCSYLKFTAFSLLVFKSVFLSSCLVDYTSTGPNGGWENSGQDSLSQNTANSSQPPTSSSISSSSGHNDSALAILQAKLDSLRTIRNSSRAIASSSSALSSAIDTSGTWEVPFTHPVSTVVFNPVGRPADPVLAGLGRENPSTLLSRDLWERMFPRRAGIHHLCHENQDFYTYDAFMAALRRFPAFASEGPDFIRRRELAAFLAQIAHETSGGAGSYDPGSDRYHWGLCWTTELAYNDLSLAYRQDHPIWPPAPGKSYHGRGPLQLTWNYNYGAAGDDLGIPFLAIPELVVASGTNAFSTALWFWMKEQSPKPSAHAAIIEIWAPGPADKRQGRWPGFGVTTNIINGGGECGTTATNSNGRRSREGFFHRFAAMLATTTGRNLDCSLQRDFRFQ